MMQDFSATSFISILNPILVAEEYKSDCLSNYSQFLKGP